MINREEYPRNRYTPSTNIWRVFSDTLEYSGNTVMNFNSFEDVFQFLYFDLTKQKEGPKDETLKIEFKFELSGTPFANYTICALVLHEQEIELYQADDKVLLP